MRAACDPGVVLGLMAAGALVAAAICGPADAAEIEASLGTGLLGSVPWGRPPLTGDWFGARRALAERGLTLGVDVVDVLQSVVAGGLDEQTENGGSVYLETQLDTGKAGLWPGGFLELRAEKLYGDFVNADSGSVPGVNLVGLFPSPGDETAVISKLLYTQFLSERFAVLVGRLDTADGEANHFSGGRGRTQFLNPRLGFSPTNVLTSPYVLNGVGALALLPNPLLERPAALSLLFADPGVEPDEAGFGGFFEEQYVAAELRVPVRLAGLPGSQNLSANYNTKDRLNLEEVGLLFPGGEAPGDRKAWVVGYNFHQYLHVEPGQDARANGYDANAAPLQGLGVFGRLSYSDADVNPTNWFASLGLGGRGAIPTRDADTYGLAGYYGRNSSNVTDLTRAIRDDFWGAELYYNVEVASWLHVTPDAQAVTSFLKDVDTTFVLGLRTRIDF